MNLARIGWLWLALAEIAVEGSALANICPVPTTDCTAVSGGCSLGSGCADGSREGFTVPDGAGGFLYPHIAGCSGGWTEPGVMHEVISSSDTISCGVISSYDTVTPVRNRPGGSACAGSGNSGSNPNGSGCNIADLCAPGWHVCVTGGDVAAHLLQSSGGGLAAGSCSDATQLGDPQLFFISRQSSNGCGWCANGCRVADPSCNLGTVSDTTKNCDCYGDGCVPGCYQDRNLSNDIFGCGNFGSTLVNDCGPLSRFSHDECSSISGGTSWFCDDHVDATTKPSYWTAGPYWSTPPGTGRCEAYTATKSDSNYGGALCCADPVLGPGSCSVNADCNDLNACTTDSCVAGLCQYASAVTCAPPNPCQTSGTCNSSTGVCEYPTLADGTCCDPGDAICRVGNACQAGSCVNDATSYPSCATTYDQTKLTVVNGTGPAVTPVCSASGTTVPLRDADNRLITLNLPANTTGTIQVTLAPSGATNQSILVEGATLPAGKSKSIALNALSVTSSLCIDDTANAQINSGSCTFPAHVVPQPTDALCLCKVYSTGCFCNTVSNCDAAPATTPTSSNCSVIFVMNEGIDFGLIGTAMAADALSVCGALATVGVGRSICRDNCSGGTCRVVVGGLLHTAVEEILDSDGDNVPDCEDRCPNSTKLNGPIPMSGRLLPHHLGDTAVMFGCNASDVLACKPGENIGERKWGLTPGTVNVFESIDTGNPIAWAAACALMYPRPHCQ